MVKFTLFFLVGGGAVQGFQ